LRRGAATPQEDAEIRPTQYTLDDFEVGQHITVKAQPGTGVQGDQWVGTITTIGVKADPNLINIKLDTPTQGGLTGLWIYPHEVTGIDEPVEEEESTESGTSGAISHDTKEKGEIAGNDQTPTREAEKASKVGQHLKCLVHGHPYPDVKVLEAYPDHFEGEFDAGDDKPHTGHFNWDEVVGEVKAIPPEQLDPATEKEAKVKEPDAGPSTKWPMASEAQAKKEPIDPCTSL
jgi:hypothetical protein